MSPGRRKLRRYLEGISLLTNTNNPPFLLVTSSRKSFFVMQKNIPIFEFQMLF